MVDNTAEKGTIKWFNPQKGYGFLTPHKGGSDVFVHISAVKEAGWETLHEGQEVSYILGPDKKTGKMCAGNIKVVA